MFDSSQFKTAVMAAVLILAVSRPSAAETDMVIEGQTPRADGSLIDWTLTGHRDAEVNRVLYAGQGSGCLPARSSTNIGMLTQAVPDYAVLTIEKYGVRPDDAPDDPMNSCSDAYFSNHTVSQRVEDARTVMSVLKARELWDDELVLFGGSEGGAVVSILSHELVEADAVIVLSTGTGLTMAEFFPMVVPPPVAEEMKKVFEQARADPDGEGRAGGSSLKWWADILDRRLSDDLLQSGIPVLLIHGQNDAHAPVAAAGAARDAFVAAGEADRLTYWELPDRDHRMVDPDGRSHMQEVLHDVGRWIRENGQ